MSELTVAANDIPCYQPKTGGRDTGNKKIIGRQRKSFWRFALVLLALCAPARILHAAYIEPKTYPFEIFTSNGGYYDSPDIDLYVVVSNGDNSVDFTFYNESLIPSSLSAVYFDDGSLLGISAVTSGPGTLFTQPATPGNLPGAGFLDPPFVTTEEFCVDGDPPPSQNGVNPVGSGEPLEWVQITFDLVGGGTLAHVLDELDTGALRIGVHVTALPDGSSESATNVPEPATVFILGLGALVVLRKRTP
ncbi:MAG: PEP-CTERM sorting domain-containing protein [Planctomycetota bacterium]